MELKKQMSFLPEPLYNPKWPKEKTLAMKALNIMLTGKRLSHPQFEANTGSWRLAAHVHILKKLGWPVEIEDCDFADTDLHERQRHFGKYYLRTDLIEFMNGL